MGQVAAFLGNEADAARFNGMAAATAAAFNQALLNASTGTYAYGQQCHQSMALAMDGLVPPAVRDAATRVLVNQILADNSTLTVGFVSFLHQVCLRGKKKRKEKKRKRPGGGGDLKTEKRKQQMDKIPVKMR
jgi:hypothetical protein